MVYVLYDREKMYGVYKTLQLVKTNCYILIYELLRLKKIDRDVYFSIKKVLFEESRIESDNLRKLLKPAGVQIDEVTYESSSLLALKNIMEHIDNRFNQLREMMQKDSRVTVKFPGSSAIDNLMITKEIRDSWFEMDPMNSQKIIPELKSFIRSKIENLQETFDGRVTFGEVSDKYASQFSYQVWPSDIGNWNLTNGTKIFGSDMALNFEFQVPGVYGIVVNPKYGYKFE